MFVCCSQSTYTQGNGRTEYCILDTNMLRTQGALLGRPILPREFAEAGGFQWSTPVVIDTSTPNVWQQLSSVLAVDDSGNLAAAWVEVFNSGGGQILVERSTNKGETWIRNVPVGLTYPGWPEDIAFDRWGNVWLLWSSTQSQFDPTFMHLSKSTDNGQTFTTLFTSREYAGPFFEPKLAIDGSNNVFVLWDDQEFKLTRFTNGDPSRRIDTEIPNDTLRVDFWCSLALAPKSNVYCVWTGGSRYKVYCSTSRDTGSTFTSTVRVDTTDFIGTYSAQRYPSCAVGTNGNVYIAYSSQSGINTLALLVATSSDQGGTFLSPVSLVDSGFNTNSSVCVDIEGGTDVLWSGDGGAHFSRSTDNGCTFTPPIVIPAGYPDLNADHLGNLFSTFETGGRAILFAKANVIVSVEERGLVPQFAELVQNFPNPFNPSTTIQFTLPQRAQVRMAIFDMLGREVEELTDQGYEAGVHHVIWKPTALSSGIYFCRLKVRMEGRESSVARNLIYLK